MKKIILLLIALLLTGCAFNEKKESNEVKLCNELDPYIEKYDNGEMTFNDIVNNLDSLYTKYCSDENNTCGEIKSIQYHTQQTYELKDCSVYEEGTYKELCEAGNNLTQESIDKKEAIEEASISSLSYSCELARESQ